MSDLTVDIIFCDDARREADGRFSLMGVFEGVRVMPTSVDTIPKLTICALVSAVQGADLSDVVIKVAVFRNDSLEHEESYPSMPLVAEVDPRWSGLIAAANIDFPLRAHFAGFLEMQNFPVHDGCVITVSTHRGKKVVSERGIAILQYASDDADPDSKLSVVAAKPKRGKKLGRGKVN